ncbi:MAG: CHAP domain-containing protein [Clostridiales bacterium]|nr:CHAP domain-containing protein [Clostridiales bacterium]
MGADEVLREAKKWVGYLEKKSDYKLEDFTANAGSANYTIFAKKYCDYGFGAYSVYQGAPWCAMAVTVIFYDALGFDRAKKIIDPYAYCPSGVNHWKSRGRWHSGASGYVPKPGDVIFFSDGSVASHTGIVYKTAGGMVYTYEGNTSSASGVVANGGSFEAKCYAIGAKRILGYGNPDWESIEEVNMEELNALKTRVAALEQKVCNPMIYNYVDKNMPEWARDAVSWCMDKGIVEGTGEGLDLDDTKLWCCTVLYRLAKELKN